ncbi:helix-turn-helix domain-containing protein [Micromonospora sp. NPDC003197]
MEAADESPQAAFSRFVRQVVDQARDERGWTVTDLAAHTRMGRSTVFRWLAGDWHDYPELAKVRGFCAALDVPVAAAFWALGLPDALPADQPDRRPATVEDDSTVAADVRKILARLADPVVPSAEKRLIRDMLRHLARRPGSTRTARTPSA